MHGGRIAGAPATSAEDFEAAAQQRATRDRSPWIIGGAFDLLFVAGGLPLILIAANILSVGWQVPAPILDGVRARPGLLLAVALIGQHLFADAHNIATYLRIWGSPEDRKRFSFHRTWLIALLVPLFIWGLWSPPATGAMVYFFLMAVFWHYVAQCYGIALIYCYKRKYVLRTFEKRVLRTLMLSLAAFTILRILTIREFSPSEWFGVALPFWGPLPKVFMFTAATLFAFSTVAFLVIVSLKVIRERKWFPLPSALLLLSVVAMGFSEGGTHALLWFYLPPFFHGTQYIAICLAYALKERGEVDRVTARALFTSPLAGKLFATSVVVGAFFYIAIPHVFSQLGFSYAMVAGLVLAIVNIHHFVTDAAIWRLRDARCREILLG